MLRKICFSLFIALSAMAAKGQVVINSITPDPVCAGAQIVISGSGLANTNSVVVGNAPADILSTSPTMVTAVVSKTVSGKSGVSVSDGFTAATDSVEVTGQDSAVFSYFGNLFCQGDTSPVPAYLPNPGGSFFSTLGLITINSTSGAIDLNQSPPGGPYTVGYTTGGTCPDTAYQTISIHQTPQPKLSYNSPLCEGEDLEMMVGSVPVAAGYITFYWYINDSLIGQGSDPVFNKFHWGLNDLSFSHGDEAKVIAEFDQTGCNNADSIILSVFPVPTLDLADPNQFINVGDPIEVSFSSNADSTQVLFELTGTGPFTPSDLIGSSTLVGIGDTGYIHPNLIILNDQSLIVLSIQVQPITAQGCVGEVDTAYITINPAGSKLFVPQFISPNGDGQNDTWLIQWNDDINPNDFEASIMDRTGKLLRTISPLHSAYDAGDLADGTYRYFIRNLNTSEIEDKGRLIVKRK